MLLQKTRQFQRKTQHPVSVHKSGFRPELFHSKMGVAFARWRRAIGRKSHSHEPWVFAADLLLLFPAKITGVQVPPLKPSETLAVPTVPPFPRFFFTVTYWV